MGWDKSFSMSWMILFAAGILIQKINDSFGLPQQQLAGSERNEHLLFVVQGKKSLRVFFKQKVMTSWNIERSGTDMSVHVPIKIIPPEWFMLCALVR